MEAVRVAEKVMSKKIGIDDSEFITKSPSKVASVMPAALPEDANEFQ